MDCPRCKTKGNLVGWNPHQKFYWCSKCARVYIEEVEQNVNV